MSRPQLCVGAITVLDGSLLMIRRGHGPAAGEWSIPGGRVEAGELLAEAVVREVREETGLECVCGPFVGWVERLDADAHFVVLDFEATALVDAHPRAASDAAEARWVPLREVGELRLVDGLAEFLREHGYMELIV